MEKKYLEQNKEFVEVITPLDVAVRVFLVPFLFLVVIISAWFGLHYPVKELSIIVIIFFLISQLALWSIKQGYFKPEPVYFLLLVSDVILAVFAIYYTGGIESFAYVIFGVIGVFAGLTLPFWGMIGIVLIAVSGYILEIYLETFKLIPHISIFKELFSPDIYVSSLYMKIMPLANITAFLIVATVSYMVAGILKKREIRLAQLNHELDNEKVLLIKREQEIIAANQQLDGKINELEDLKKGLEERVRGRTAELEEMKTSLEHEVAKRTEELQNERDRLDENVKARTAELQGKINDLQTMVDASVGRELKMIEMEKEITALKSNGR